MSIEFYTPDEWEAGGADAQFGYATGGKFHWGPRWESEEHQVRLLDWFRKHPNVQIPTDHGPTPVPEFLRRYFWPEYQPGHVRRPLCYWPECKAVGSHALSLRPVQRNRSQAVNETVNDLPDRHGLNYACDAHTVPLPETQPWAWAAGPEGLTLERPDGSRVAELANVHLGILQVCLEGQEVGYTTWSNVGILMARVEFDLKAQGYHLVGRGVVEQRTGA